MQTVKCCNPVRDSCARLHLGCSNSAGAPFCVWASLSPCRGCSSCSLISCLTLVDGPHDWSPLQPGPLTWTLLLLPWQCLTVSPFRVFAHTDSLISMPFPPCYPLARLLPTCHPPTQVSPLLWGLSQAQPTPEAEFVPPLHTSIPAWAAGVTSRQRWELELRCGLEHVA